MKALRANDYVLYEDDIGFDYWANVADENSLFHVVPGLKNYEDITEIPISYLTTTEPSLSKKKTMFQDMLKNSGRVRYVDRDDLVWKLKGDGEVRFKCLGNVNGGITNPGQNNVYGYLYGETEFYVEGDVLAPLGAMDYNVVIQENPEPYGQGWRYPYLVAEGSRGFFIPEELFEDGQEWIKIDSVYGEASHGYGSTFFEGGSYTEFGVNLTHIGKKVEVTNEAHNKNLRIRFLDNSGKPMDNIPDKIISLLEAKFMTDLKFEKEMRMLVGRSIGKSMTDPSSQYHRKAGPGIVQLMEYGNVFPYPTEGSNIIDILEDHFQSVWMDRVDFTNRDVVVATGTPGIIKAQNDIQKKIGQSNLTLQDMLLIKKIGGIKGSNMGGLEYPTHAPLKYNTRPWGSITFEHWPVLDSHYITGSIKHPVTGMPASGYYYIVLDYGVGSGSGSNIEMLRRRGAEAFNYICGTWSPVGALNNVTGSKSTKFVSTHNGRYYELNYSDTYGVRIKDVLKTMLFKPSFVR